MIPADWTIERVDDRHIRVVDPQAPFAVVLNLSDQAPEMRVFWRLCCDLMGAPSLSEREAFEQEFKDGGTVDYRAWAWQGWQARAGQLTGYRCCACGLVREREGK